MNVLIVDDQIHVVSGIYSGVDWAGIGVGQVFRAYSAFEAREILTNQQVDVMLCDIEMPAEDGLSLYRWVKKEEISVECIFLTAHADFSYAQEAIHLGGFDYILQPVRYEEIQNALLRARHKINLRQRAHARPGEDYTGSMNAILDGFFRECFLGVRPVTAHTLEQLTQFNLRLQAGQPAACALLQFVDGSGEIWEEDLLRYAVNNILSEVLAVCQTSALLIRLEEGLYGILLYSDKPVFTCEAYTERLRVFQRILKQQLGFGTACYYSGIFLLEELAKQAPLLLKQKADNVAFMGGLFAPADMHKGEEIQMDMQMRKWALMLDGQNALPVREEIHAYLDRLLLENRLNARCLKLFYQKLLEMLIVQAKKQSIQLLEPAKILDEYLTAYQSVDQMKKLADCLIPYFQTAIPEESSKQIDRILQYIYNHMEEEIRRTDIAREVFLNPDYLSRMFKKEMGVSLKEFITGEKMKTAKNLLKSTSLPIGTIALRVGYSNFSHFSQSYRRVMGMTPEEQRQ